MAIVIATCHFGDIDPRWMLNFEQVQRPGPRADGSPGWCHVASLRRIVDKARNEAVEALLQRPAAEEWSHLLFWDDDVLLPPDGVLRLLAHSLPIVSGLYVGREPPYPPMAFRLLETGAFVSVTRFAPGLNAVDFVGAGCLLVRREVFERMAPPWFALSLPTASDPGMGEDVHFCRQACALGYPILVDFAVQCGHLMKRAATWADFQAAQASGRGVVYSSAEANRLASEVRTWPPEPVPVIAPSAAAAAAAARRGSPSATSKPSRSIRRQQARAASRSRRGAR